MIDDSHPEKAGSLCWRKGHTSVRSSRPGRLQDDQLQEGALQEGARKHIGQSAGAQHSLIRRLVAHGWFKTRTEELKDVRNLS